uniref:protein prenyltransferase alpha subunit repeat-containing protein 1 isoform X2 n=1 Tax=Monopterus albus TaxID=43700 RepID=UPI0009B43A49|nr:protein prenyltransferase alpha subunit repeat-containing protein 1 isoform X2 [Monopterus albus]
MCVTSSGTLKMAESKEEVDVLVMRVVKDITNAFKRNPNIDEIGVIPCPGARYNRSPIVLVENKLGVESWCVKFLLPYVHNKLLLYRQRKHWLDRETLVDITCTLLLLNPDFTTAWNVRKELLQCGVLNLEKDLYLGKLALTKFPKSPETWIHRRWVLQQILHQFSAVARSRKQHHQGEVEQADAERSQQLSDYLARTLHQEMKVFHDELSSMRLWVSMHVSDHSGFHYRQFLFKELITELSQTPACTTTSSSKHQSNTVPSSSSHHHNHGQANGELSGAEAAGGEERWLRFTKILQLFHQEMELCSDLIQSFPGHETLWSHRRHIFYLWHHLRREHQQHCSSNGSVESVHFNNSDPCLPEVGAQSCAGQGVSVNGQKHINEPMEVDAASLPDPHDSKRLKRGIMLPAPPALLSEHNFVSSILDTCANPEQRRFAMAYKKWLDTVIGQQP